MAGSDPVGVVSPTPTLPTPSSPGEAAPTGSLPPLIRIQGDSSWAIVRRRGRFSMDRLAAESPIHYKEGIKQAAKDMVRELKWKFGQEFVPYEPGFQFRGMLVSPPQSHMPFSPDVTPDKAIEAPPPPPVNMSLDQLRNYYELAARYERAEKSRVARSRAKDASLQSEKVDFVLVGHFKQKVTSVNAGRSHLPSLHEARKLLRRPLQQTASK